MNLLTDSQWARYSALCARLRPVPAAERVAALQHLRATGDEDPQVLSLVALHYALPPDPDRLRTGERVGHCTLEEPLGTGGMGVVYRAQQHLGTATRPVAVKLIHPALLRTARAEALTRFRDEISTLVKLEHEGIARIYDGGLYEDPRTHNQMPYLVMELVRGGLPITTYAEDYALAWQERLALFLRVCHAVRYAHEHRVVHRDLKPANILVDSDGRPVVIDFGLAQACDALLPGAHLAASGTPAYMSPEQVSDAFGAVSDKSDVYALGLILYELLTEQLPYTLPHDGSIAQLRQVITEAVPPPLHQFGSEYRGELDAIMAAALAKRPADRLPVAVFRSRLERALQKWAPPAVVVPLAPVPPAPPAAPLPVQSLTSGPRTAGLSPPEAERRQLTVLFCDLVDSTRLAGQLDPEDFREVIHAYHGMCTEVMQCFDGHIAQYLGDGLLVYFGYPQAHEDAAQRAVRSGLDLVDALAGLNMRLERERGVRLALRLGIHTGLVVIGAVGGGGQQEPLALGDTPNIAARLQDLAQPDTVMLSHATYQLVRGYIVCQELGERELRGVRQPLRVYRALGTSGARSRLDVVPPQELTPLVGRERELGLLRDRWEQTKVGMGQVVLLVGEAGIGKSRLAAVLKDHISGVSSTLWECQCSPLHQHSALYPLIDLLQRVLQWQRHDSSGAKLQKLEATVAQYGLVVEEMVPLVAAMLSLALPTDRYPPLALSPERQKQKTVEVLLTWLLKAAEQQPVCVVLEDLHWGDPSTLEFLTLLVDQVPTTCLLVLLLARPEFRPLWAIRTHLTQITLSRLSRPQVETMIAQSTGGKALPAEVLQHIVTKTDGVPLFIEELMKMVLESGLVIEREGYYELTGSLAPLTIPTTLHDALMARLDRLGPAKQVAQLGAVVGSEFAYEVLQAVAPMEEAMLQQGLAQLVDAELLYQRGLLPQARYRFKHVLIQEAAYQSLLKRTRRQYHQQIAEVLAEQFPETTETQPELLAHHYTEAGLIAQAIPYWQRAGQRARVRSAFEEAIAHLTQGLELLETLPDTPERTRQELDLQTALGSALAVTKGYTAPDVERVYVRAYALCQAVGDTRQLFRVLQGLHTFYNCRGQFQKSRELAEQLPSLARRVQDPALLLAAHRALGELWFQLAEFSTALAHCEQGIALSQEHGALALGYGGGLGVDCLSVAARILWQLGYPDQALQRSHEALTLAQTYAHPHPLAAALCQMAHVHHLRREAPQSQEWAETAKTLAREQGFSYWLMWGTFTWGWARATQGAPEPGIAQMCQSVAAKRAAGHEEAQPFALAQLAEVYLDMGQVEEGQRLLAEALAVARHTGECWGEAELYRLQGEFLLARSVGNNAEAETCFRQALEVARRQGAKSLELRAAMSLSRLWQQQGKRAEAYELLAPLYGWFTEGFDTGDLQEAKALLEQLGS